MYVFIEVKESINDIKNMIAVVSEPQIQDVCQKMSLFESLDDHFDCYATYYHDSRILKYVCFEG